MGRDKRYESIGIRCCSISERSAPRYYTEAVEICESQAQIEAQVVCTVTHCHIVGSQEYIKLGDSIDWSLDTYRIDRH